MFFVGKRTQEIICVWLCISLMILNLYLIVRHFRFERVSIVIMAALCGILTADFGSGLVHWAADTWGSVDLPIIGKVSFLSTSKWTLHQWIVSLQNFLRPFREHHIDPTSITRHDFIETNGDNFMIAIPILGKLAYNFLARTQAEIQQDFAFSAYLFLCSIFVAMTNQVSWLKSLVFDCILSGSLVDSQMVSHLLGSAKVGGAPSGLPRNAA